MSAGSAPQSPCRTPRRCCLDSTWCRLRACAAVAERRAEPQTCDVLIFFRTASLEVQTLSPGP
eukprot:4623829-Pyramimonas_sp.AAC.1